MSIRFNGNLANFLSRTASVPNYNAPYTAMGWLKVKVDTGVTQGAFALSPLTGANSFDFFGPEDSDLFVLAARFTDGVIETDTGSAVSLDVWLHWAVVRTSITEIKLYIDAVLDAEPAPLDMTGRATATVCNVGLLTINGSTFIPLDAETAFYRIWTTALTPAEIASERTSPVAVKTDDLFGDYPMLDSASAGDDISGNGNHFTVNGTITTGASEPSLGIGPSLFRGRNFPFFDDEQVNRFEFWPAVAGTAEHERSVSLAATGNVSASGVFFSVLDRTVAIDSASTVAVAGVRVVDRAASFSATGTIESVATSFSVFEATVSLDAAAQVTSSAIFLSSIERAAAIDVAATIDTVAASFTTSERIVIVNTAASIDIAAEFFSTLERQASINGLSAIVVSGQTEQLRQIAISASAAISVSGEVVALGAAEHERSVTLNTSGEIAATAISFSLTERSSSVSVTATVTSAGVREVERAASLTTTGAVETSGEYLSIFERTVSLDSAVSVTISGQATADTERSASISALGAVSAAGVRALTRAVSFNTLADIAVSRQLEIHRSVALHGVGSISVSGETGVQTASVVIVTRQSIFASPRISKGEFSFTTTKPVTFADTKDVTFQ